MSDSSYFFDFLQTLSGESLSNIVTFFMCASAGVKEEWIMIFYRAQKTSYSPLLNWWDGAFNFLPFIVDRAITWIDSWA